MKNFFLKTLFTTIFIAFAGIIYGQIQTSPLNSVSIHPFGTTFDPLNQFASIGESGAIAGPVGPSKCDLYGFRAQLDIKSAVNIGMQIFVNQPPLGLPKAFPVITTNTDLGLGILEQNSLPSTFNLGCGNLLAVFKQSTTNNNVLTLFGGITATSGVFGTSDRNLKRNIQPITNALEIVSQLNGYTYEYRRDERPELNLPKGQRYGFVTQEVQKVMPTIVRQGSDVQGKATDYQVMEYDAVIPVLAEAIKMQQVLITDLEKENSALEDRLARLEAIILKDKAPNNKVDNVNNASGVKLGQNSPNPSDMSTTINYTLPENIDNANLVVFDLKGQTMSSQLINTGNGTVELNTNTWAAGVYVYSIVVDGRVLARKKMTVK